MDYASIILRTIGTKNILELFDNNRGKISKIIIGPSFADYT